MWRGLEFRIFLVVFALVVLVMGGASVAVVWRVGADFDHLAEERVGSVAVVVSGLLAREMLKGEIDPELLRFKPNQLPRAVRAIDIVNHEGRPAFHAGAPVLLGEEARRARETRETHVTRGQGEVSIHLPLLNDASCRSCHDAARPVLGLVRVSASTADHANRVAATKRILALGAVAAVVGLALLLIVALRRLVVRPLRRLRHAVSGLARGDLRFTVGEAETRELQAVQESLASGIASLAALLARVQGLARAAGTLSKEIQGDTSQVVENEAKVAGDMDRVTSSARHLRASASVVAASVNDLASSTQTTASRVAAVAGELSVLDASVHELSGALATTSSTLEEMTANEAELAHGAGELSQLADRTVGAVEKLVASLQEVHGEAARSAELAGEAATRAETEGLRAIQRTLAGMEEILLAVRQTGAVLERLKGRSGEIGKVIGVIAEVADHTGLLALNAAILAAQAGDKGRGFAIVAEEVKALAMRTAASTREIGALVVSVQEDVGAAVSSMETAHGAVRDGEKLARAASSVMDGLFEQSRASALVAARIADATAREAERGRSVTADLAAVLTSVDRVATATSQQAAGVISIRDAAEQVRHASAEASAGIQRQSVAAREGSAAVAAISQASGRLARASAEELEQATRIEQALERVRELPATNRVLAERAGQLVQGLVQEIRQLNDEVSRLKLPAGHAGG
jgi:methyl-accepting chemotaxis protein